MFRRDAIAQLRTTRLLRSPPSGGRSAGARATIRPSGNSSPVLRPRFSAPWYVLPG